MNFSINLKILRERKGLSQARLAKELGVSVACVGMWESTAQIPPARKLLELSEYFNITIDELLKANLIDKDENINSNPISQKEYKLIKTYRILSPELQDMLWGILGTWTGEAVKQSNKV